MNDGAHFPNNFFIQRCYIQYLEMKKQFKTQQEQLTNPHGKSLDRYKEQYQKSQPDLYIILKHKIYPLHKQYMGLSRYISNKIASNQKVIIIGFEINIQGFEKVIEFLYTFQFIFQRDTKIQQVLQIAKLLQIPKLQKLILQDFHSNFDEYNIFFLYKLAHIYNIKQLQNKCHQQLTNLDYQQININRYNLYDLDQNLFEKIIKNHQKLKIHKKISGLKTHQIQEVISQYNQYRGCQIKFQHVIRVDHKDYIQSSQIITPIKIKKVMTLSPEKSEQGKNKQKRTIKSCQSMDSNKNFKDDDDKIKQILIGEIQKPYSQMINTLNQASKSGYLGYEVEKIMQISSRGSKYSLIDSLQNQGKNTSSYKCVKQFSNLGSSDSLDLRQMNQADLNHANHVKNQSQFQSTQVQTIKSEKETSYCGSFMLKIPQISKNITF